MTISISIPVSVGELFDKLTILDIKAANIRSKKKLDLINREIAALEQVIDTTPGLDGVLHIPEFQLLYIELADVNTQLWDVEEKLRALEAEEDFGAEFINLARKVYFLNDERARIKRIFNDRLGSEIVEVKSYA